MDIPHLSPAPQLSPAPKLTPASPSVVALQPSKLRSQLTRTNSFKIHTEEPDEDDTPPGPPSPTPGSRSPSKAHRIQTPIRFESPSRPSLRRIQTEERSPSRSTSIRRDPSSPHLDFFPPILPSPRPTLRRVNTDDLPKSPSPTSSRRVSPLLYAKSPFEKAEERGDHHDVVPLKIPRRRPSTKTSPLAELNTSLEALKIERRRPSSRSPIEPLAESPFESIGGELKVKRLRPRLPARSSTTPAPASYSASPLSETPATPSPLYQSSPRTPLQSSPTKQNLSTTPPTSPPQPAATMSILNLPPTDREKLRQHFAQHPTDTHPEAWNDLYKKSFTPWDKGFPNPALVETLERKDLFGEGTKVLNAKNVYLRRKKALVPGCGRGYDVFLLAAFGYDAYGLESSELALEDAKRLGERIDTVLDGRVPDDGIEISEEEKAKYEVYHTRDLSVGRGAVHWVTGDFFKNDWQESIKKEEIGLFDGTFEVIYDYTFLSALPPSLRPAWSKRYSELLAPTGHLICLEFPTYKPLNSGGPPWALPPSVYEAHLPRPGKELQYDDEGKIVESSLGEVGSPGGSQKGLVRLDHFQPKKSHDIGYVDGKLTDWVGVWVHPRSQS